MNRSCPGWMALSALAGCASAAPPAPVPTDAPKTLTLQTLPGIGTPICVAVADGQATQPVRLRQVFLEPFDRLDTRSGRWQPHYDGGYDWAVKRTLKTNREQQFYVDRDYRGTGRRALGLDPFRVDRGILSIVADRTPDAALPFLYGYRYTSGLLTTRRSLTMRYGYYEMRARVPAGRGLWPAFWLLPDTRRDASPEIDVIEVRGSDPTAINMTTHWDDHGRRAQSRCQTRVSGADGAYHTYGVLMAPDRLTYYIDRRPVGTIATPSAVARKRFYMLVNLAVGGVYDGPIAADTRLPATFDIDHVTAYAIDAGGPMRAR